MRYIRMSDLGVSSGRGSYSLSSFGSGFVMDDQEWLEEDPNEELIEEVCKPVAVPVSARSTKLLVGTRC